METKTTPSQERLIQVLEKMGELQKRFLIIRLYYLLLLHKIKQIPRLIFTPAGVLVDRRKSYRFHWPERRAVEVLRWKMRLWFYSEDDSHPTQP